MPLRMTKAKIHFLNMTSVCLFFFWKIIKIVVKKLQQQIFYLFILIQNDWECAFFKYIILFILQLWFKTTEFRWPRKNLGLWIKFENGQSSVVYPLRTHGCFGSSWSDPRRCWNLSVSGWFQKIANSIQKNCPRCHW